MTYSYTKYRIRQLLATLWHRVIPINSEDENVRYRRLMLIRLGVVVKDGNGDLWQHESEKYYSSCLSIGQARKGYQLQRPIRIVSFK